MGFGRQVPLPRALPVASDEHDLPILNLSNARLISFDPLDRENAPGN